jgi:hypothetical protein
MSGEMPTTPLDPSQQPGPIRMEPQLGRGSVERSPLPHRCGGGRGTGDRFEERTLQVRLSAAILICATIVVGQLWALTAALDAWLGRDTAAVGWLIAFQAASFGVSLLVWASTPRGR